MTGQIQPRLTRKKRVRAYSGRGEIYAWLRTHHGDVFRRRVVEQHPWPALVSEMVCDGVRREDGLEPTVKNASRVWERVCRDVAAEAAAAKPKPVPPSRISPDWRPTVVPQKAVASPSMSMPLTAASLPSSPSTPEGPPPVDPRIDTTLPLEAQESLRQLFKDFDDVANSRLKF
jgi:hypothetical protein